MDWQPVHEVKIEHNWHRKAERRDLEFGGYIGMEKCKDCGKSREYLSLSTEDGYSWDSLSREQQLAKRREMAERATKTFDLIEDLQRAQLKNTPYEDFFEVIREIKRKSQPSFDAGEMPVWQLQFWLKTNRKALKRKLLLAFKQGLVCNRCDRIAFTIENLTVDHIRPRSEGGKEQLTNLQLLCRRCNEYKADKSPNGLDISPFSPNVQQCIHRVNCVELRKLRRSFEAN